MPDISASTLVSSITIRTCLVLSRLSQKRPLCNLALRVRISTGLVFHTQIRCAFSPRKNRFLSACKKHTLLFSKLQGEAITNSRSLKTYLTAALDKAPDLDLSFRLPEPDDSADA